MAVIKFSVPILKNLPLPAKGQVVYFDSITPRFGLAVYQSGRKSFLIKYYNKYGKYKWLTIGNFPELTLEQARTKARGLLAEIALGNDPSEEKTRKKKAMTVAELCDLYFQIGTSDKKLSTIANDKGRVETLIKPLIGNIPVESLTRANVHSMMNDIINGDKVRRCEKSDKPRGKRIVRGGKGAAARTMQTLGAILSFAKLQGIITDNPAHGIKKPKDNVKDVFLTRNEIKQFGQLLATPVVIATHQQVANALKLLLLTGCRHSEILELKWDYVDLENQVFRFPDTKTGRQTRPFGKAAANLLKSIKSTSNNTDWVFPSIRGDGPLTNVLKPLKKICKLTDKNGNLILNKPDLTVHALRHTYASLGGDLGYSDIIIAAIIGHKLNTVTNRYTHTVDSTIIAVADKISNCIQEQLDAGAEQARQQETQEV